MRNGYRTLIVVAAWHLLGACVLEVDHEGTAYRCDEAPVCPDGFDCVEGVCTRPTVGLPDAAVADASIPDAVPEPDAKTNPPDATAGVPDAALPPPPQTLSFGETDADDVRGVTTDTSVDIGRRDQNFGTRHSLLVDADPYMGALVRFDVSAIPAGSVIQAARIVVWTTSDELEDGSVTVFRVLEDWDEGDFNGLPGTANYDLRKASTAWTAAGVGPGSRETTAVAEFVPHTADTRWETALATAPVQAWIDDPGANHGLVFLTTNAGGRGCTFKSSDSDAVERRPRLIVTFRPPT